MKSKQLCPCESGKPFSECHGAGAEEIPMVVRPLHIFTLAMPDGRVYKTIGTDPRLTQEESLKTARWIGQQRRGVGGERER